MHDGYAHPGGNLRIVPAPAKYAIHFRVSSTPPWASFPSGFGEKPQFCDEAETAMKSILETFGSASRPTEVGRATRPKIALKEVGDKPLCEGTRAEVVGSLIAGHSPNTCFNLLCVLAGEGPPDRLGSARNLVAASAEDERRCPPLIAKGSET
jgi:hypothetical protein